MIKLKSLLMEFFDDEFSNSGLQVRRIFGSEDEYMYRYFIEKIHYLHTLPDNIYVRLGIFYNNIMIGAIGYSSPRYTSLYKSLGLNTDELIELARLVVVDSKDTSDLEWFKKAQEVELSIHNDRPESRSIVMGNKLIEKLYPNVKVISTYADANQAHSGGIYKGSNAIPYGKSKKCSKNLFIYLTGNDSQRKETMHRIYMYGNREPLENIFGWYKKRFGGKAETDAAKKERERREKEGFPTFDIDVDMVSKMEKKYGKPKMSVNMINKLKKEKEKDARAASQHTLFPDEN